MNRKELIDTLAAKTGSTKADADRNIAALIEIITSTLKKGDNVALVGFGTFEVRGFYWINKPQIVKAGKAVDQLLPKDATVIAPYNGDAAFLYQTNRHGYPIVDRPLEKFIDEGTKYLVSVDVADAGIQNLIKHCKVIDQTQDYVIVEMFKECIGR